MLFQGPIVRPPTNAFRMAKWEDIEAGFKEAASSVIEGKWGTIVDMKNVQI